MTSFGAEILGSPFEIANRISLSYKITNNYASITTKVWQEVMEQLFKVNKPNISLSVPVNLALPLYGTRTGGVKKRNWFEVPLDPLFLTLTVWSFSS